MINIKWFRGRADINAWNNLVVSNRIINFRYKYFNLINCVQTNELCAKKYYE